MDNGAAMKNSKKALEAGQLDQKAREKDDTTVGGLSESERENEIGANGNNTPTEQKADASTWDWNSDPDNPYNWPTGKKWKQVAMISSFGFLASIGTSIMAPAHEQLVEEFDVTVTQSILPLSMYVFALGLGPVLGGPMSETWGRYLTFVGLAPLGALFTLGAGFVHNFAGLCILRFLAGFCFAPSLAISSGTLNETFLPVERGLPATIFILTPFLGPGVAPVMGSFIVNRKGWRWTQWTILFFFIQSMVVALVFGNETYHPILKRRKEKKLGLPVEPKPPMLATLKLFLTVALLRPVLMMLTEPIVAFICLYTACMFATLFTFFAAVPYVFQGTYHFTIEQSGLVFISIVVGCVLGVITIVLCDIFFYRPQIAKHPPHQVPPEWRLVPAMIGSIGLPIGLFWFAWTARSDISWASPAVAMVPFAWGNICLFISCMSYTTDLYKGSVVASAASANSLARYGLAGAFPLFTLQMYEKLGINWASSLLAFLAVALLPIPWVLFKFGHAIRARSKYETASY